MFFVFISFSLKAVSLFYVSYLWDKYNINGSRRTKQLNTNRCDSHQNVLCISATLTEKNIPIRWKPFLNQLKRTYLSDFKRTWKYKKILQVFLVFSENFRLFINLNQMRYSSKRLISYNYLIIQHSMALKHSNSLA